MDSLSQQITDKLEQEFKEYKAKVLKMEPPQIFEKSYETTVKYEMLDMIQAHDDYFSFLPASMQARLLSLDYLLDTFYTYWINSDDNIWGEFNDFIHAIFQHKNIFGGNTE